MAHPHPDERPLETEYYDILGVTVTATEDEIKRSYRRLAIKNHPDKNPNDPHAEENFKRIAVAYTTLADPATRKKYNEFGASAGKAGGGEDGQGVVDPEAVFSSLFGGERFVDIIGTISLGQEMKAAMQEVRVLLQSLRPRPSLTGVRNAGTGRRGGRGRERAAGHNHDWTQWSTINHHNHRQEEEEGVEPRGQSPES